VPEASLIVPDAPPNVQSYRVAERGYWLDDEELVVCETFTLWNGEDWPLQATSGK